MNDSFEKRWATVGAPAKAALNGALFYACWGIILFYAVIQRPFVAIGVIPPFLVVHYFLTDNWPRDRILITSLVISGSIIDSLMMYFGVISFASPNVLLDWMCPIWISVLHLVFASSINLSMVWIGRKWWLASFFGATGAPFSYYMGAQVGAATLGFGLYSCFIIGIVWAFYLPLIYRYSKYIEKNLV